MATAQPFTWARLIYGRLTRSLFKRMCAPKSPCFRPSKLFPLQAWPYKILAKAGLSEPFICRFGARGGGSTGVHWRLFAYILGHSSTGVNKKPQKFIFEYWVFSQKSYLNVGCFEEIDICIPKF